MSDIKATLNSARGVAGAAPTALPERQRAPTGIQQKTVPGNLLPPGSEAGSSGDAEALIKEFIAPPDHVRAWLGDPMIGPVLAQVSRELAPEGSAEDAQARYAASVIETHLAARKHLASRLNALIRA